MQSTQIMGIKDNLDLLCTKSRLNKMQLIKISGFQRDWISKFETFVLILICSLVYTATHLSHDALPGKNNL
jgi:hypothetical protein